MDFENYYFAVSQDTHKNDTKVVPAKSQVQISLDAVKMTSFNQNNNLNKNDILTTRQQEITPKKQYVFRKKSPENQNLINDSTIYLKPRPDYFLQQIQVRPRGIILPSRSADYHYTDWFTVVLFFPLILFAVVKYSSHKYFPLLFQSIVSFSASSRLYREQNISLKQGSAIMELFYPLVLALFGFQLIKYTGLSLPFSDIITFLLCFAVIYLFLLIKEMVYRTLGFMSETQSDTNEYLFNVKNHNKVLSVFLLPLVGFIAWSPFCNLKLFFFAGLILIVVFYLLYLFRGIKILLKKQYSILYLFLYLCTLEFLPLVLIFKSIR